MLLCVWLSVCVFPDDWARLFHSPHCGAVVNIEVYRPTFTPPPLRLFNRARSEGQWRKDWEGEQRLDVSRPTYALDWTHTHTQIHRPPPAEHTPIITCSNSKAPSLFPATHRPQRGTVRRGREEMSAPTTLSHKTRSRLNLLQSPPKTHLKLTLLELCRNNTACQSAHPSTPVLLGFVFAQQPDS